MIKILAEAWLKKELEKRLKDELKGVDPKTAPAGTEIRVKSGYDVAAFGRDVDVHFVFVINDRKPNR